MIANDHGPQLYQLRIQEDEKRRPENDTEPLMSGEPSNDRDKHDRRHAVQQEVHQLRGKQRLSAGELHCQSNDQAIERPAIDLDGFRPAPGAEVFRRTQVEHRVGVGNKLRVGTPERQQHAEQEDQQVRPPISRCVQDSERSHGLSIFGGHVTLHVARNASRPCVSSSGSAASSFASIACQ